MHQIPLVHQVAPAAEAGSVRAFAAELRKDPAVLMEQLQAAGVHKASADDRLTEDDKLKLLEYLRDSHGTALERKRITIGKRRDVKGQQARDRTPARLFWGSNLELARKLYVDLIRSFFVVGPATPSILKFLDAARRTAAMQKQLRRIGNALRQVGKSAVASVGGWQPQHAGAFFHALKVDGRNLP